MTLFRRIFLAIQKAFSRQNSNAADSKVFENEDNSCEEQEFFISPNARNAEARGLFTVDMVTEEILSSNGFCYGVDFFRWLCGKSFIRPQEFHHKGYLDANRKTSLESYYSDETIKYIVRRYDLEFLHNAFIENMTRSDMIELRGIKFCKVEMMSSLITGKEGGRIECYCIKCKGKLYFSPQKAFKEGPKIRILKEWNENTQEFVNKSCDKIIRMLLTYKD